MYKYLQRAAPLNCAEGHKMLVVNTIKNFIAKDGKPCCFRSNVDQSLDLESLISEIIKYNSTLTEADVRACFSVLDSKVREFANKGYKVELPFCYINLKATGTCDTLLDSFSEGTQNHKIGVRVTIKEDAFYDMTNGAKYKQVDSSFSMNPKISYVYAIKNDSSKSEELNFASGDIIEIVGKNLGIDYADEKQGVFLESTAKTVRITRYNRLGTNIIDCFIQDAIGAGTYNVIVRTKPGTNRYAEYKYHKQITIA